MCMSKFFFAENGLCDLRSAFPEDKELFKDVPVLSNIYTGCKKKISFCWVLPVKSFFYVKEMLSGRTYKTKKLSYEPMQSGIKDGKLTSLIVNEELAIRID